MQLSGTAKLSVHGKRLVAESMYAKGKSFLAAAMLLRRKGGYEYVVLHLLCQGIEITLKAMLLAIDYDTFKPKLKKLGHNLVSVADTLASATKFSAPKGNVKAELTALSNLYSQHLLRYGSGYDILVNPSTIPSNRVLRRVAALLRLVERKGSIYARNI